MCGAKELQNCLTTQHLLRIKSRLTQSLYIDARVQASGIQGKMPHDASNGVERCARFQQTAGQGMTQRVQSAAVQPRQFDAGLSPIIGNDRVQVIIWPEWRRTVTGRPCRK